MVDGRKVHPDVYAMVVPGSYAIKQQAESEGLDRRFKEAGFDWREAGCSMCLAMNDDRLDPADRCADDARGFAQGNGRGTLCDGRADG